MERLTNELALLGLQVECFDFDYQSPTELRTYDVVEMIGGNPYYLLHSIRKNGFGEILDHFAINVLSAVVQERLYSPPLST